MPRNWKNRILNYLESPPEFIRALLFKKLDKEFTSCYKEKQCQFNKQLSFGKTKKGTGRK